MPIAYDASRRALLHPESGRSLLGRGPTPGEEALAAEAARLAYRRFEEGADELERLAADLARGGFATPALRVVRAVDCCDVVTEVPPIALGFQHLGVPVYIDRLGAASGDASAAFIEEHRREARATYLGEHSFRIGTVLVRDLADHAPISYLRAFWP